MERKKPKHSEFKQSIPIHAETLKHHPELPLHLNFCFINGHPYFATITRKVDCRKIIQFHGQGRKEILNRLQEIVDRHTKRGFHVNEYHADNEFKKIEAYLVSYKLHTQAADEHKPTLEQKTRTLKDRTRSTVHSLPYRKMPLLMIDSIVGQAKSMLNALPSKIVISTTISEINII